MKATLLGISSLTALLLAGCHSLHLLGIGPAFHETFDRIESGMGMLVPGKSGNALQIKAKSNGTHLLLPQGCIGPAGCIEFWARIDGSSPNCLCKLCPQFFTVYADGENRISLGYTDNNGHGRSGLAFRFWGLAFSDSGAACGTFRRDGEPTSDPFGWHHYALVWDKDGIDLKGKDQEDTPTLVCFIDGQPVLSAGNAATFDPKAFSDQTQWLASPLTLDISDIVRSKQGYTIDELKIWSTPKKNFDTSK